MCDSNLSLQFQTKGDRQYLAVDLRIKYQIIELLKKFNDNYPQSSLDYDKKNLYHLLRAVFSCKDLKACGKKESVVCLPVHREKIV